MKKIVAFFLAFSILTPYAYAEKFLIPGGEIIGISLRSEGLLVTKTTALENTDGKKVSPAEDAGIKPGDRIISADGNRIDFAEQLTEYVSSRKNDIVLTLMRDEKSINTVITPVFSDNSYKLGILVREGTAGIGTITFKDPETGKFGALGHGISDIDTNTLIQCKNGRILSCTLNAPTKGKRGTPGELNGTFGSETLGHFKVNSPNGLFGALENPESFSSKEAVEAADFSAIQKGEAYILSDVDGQGVKKYTIDIKKTSEGNLDGKNIVFKVTDKELINKTGGIVQGMSGSPIIQNGKIVGAVTHVFVNDPTRGYGIFIENMLSEAEKVK